VVSGARRPLWRKLGAGGSKPNPAEPERYEKEERLMNRRYPQPFVEGLWPAAGRWGANGQ